MCTQALTLECLGPSVVVLHVLSGAVFGQNTAQACNSSPRMPRQSLRKPLPTYPHNLPALLRLFCSPAFPCQLNLAERLARVVRDLDRTSLLLLPMLIRFLTPDIDPAPELASSSLLSLILLLDLILVCLPHPHPHTHPLFRPRTRVPPFPPSLS